MSNKRRFIRRALSLSIAASIGLAAGVATADPPVPAQWKFKYSNWEQFQNDQLDPVTGNFRLAPALGNGTEDLRGVIQLTQILENDFNSPNFNQPVWNSGDGGEFIYGVFYGLDLITQTVNSPTDLEFEYAGGSLDLYILPAPINPLALGVAGFGATSNIYTAINGGGQTPWLTANMGSGCSANAAATICSNSSLAVPFVDGNGNFFLDVGATANGVGTANPNFDTNGAAFGRDALAQNDFRSPLDADSDGDDDINSIPCGPGVGAACTRWLGDWHLVSEDPVEGNFIPEPGSLALLGMGLLGLGAARRRRARS